MTFGDVDQQNQQALETLDRVEDERAEPDSAEEPTRYRVSDQEALAIAAQHDLQVNYKW